MPVAACEVFAPGNLPGEKSKKPALKAGFSNLAPLTGLELHLHLLLLLPLLNIAIFLPTYLPSLLFSCGKNVN
jgi:hypothetical protein